MVDFSLSEEQQLLKDSLDRFVREHYSLDQRRKLVASDNGYSKENWAQFAELGWLAIPIDPEYDGIGGGPLEIMLVMEAIGRGLVVEPYLATVVLGAGLVSASGNGTQKQNILPKVAAGDMLMAFAHVEPQARYNLSDVQTVAKQDGDGFILSGAKTVVLHGAHADQLVVSARSSGARTDTDGLSLFLIDPSAAGVSVRGYRTVDGLRAADVTLDNVAVDAASLLGTAGDAWPAIANVVDNAVAALCAEALGCMETLHETTREYLKTREQFGLQLSKFQVLQHRSVDMMIACEEMRSLLYMATMSLDAEPSARATAVSAAKHHAGEGGKKVGQEAVQLHGGMGMTEELSVGHYFKRLTMIDTMFGNADFHLDRFAAVSTAA